MAFILLFIIACGILAFTKQKPQYHVYFIFLGILLAIHSGIRSSDPDHAGYIYYYFHLKDAEVEPTFKIIVAFSKMIYKNEPIIMFIIYAFIGVFLKMRAIAFLSHFLFLSLAIYVSEYYILHEMTQIRAGVAGGFLLLSIKPLYEKKWLQFFSCCVFAFLFHYSAIIMLALPLLNPQKINRLWWGITIPLAYVILPLIRLALGFLLDLSFGSDKIDAYLFAISQTSETSINIFSPIQLIRIIIAVVVLFFCNKCFKHNKYSYLLIKCYIIGIILSLIHI